jgi:hypothetical protein
MHSTNVESTNRVCAIENTHSTDFESTTCVRASVRALSLWVVRRARPISVRVFGHDDPIGRARPRWRWGACCTTWRAARTDAPPSWPAQATAGTRGSLRQGDNRPISINLFPRRALTLCPQLCMGTPPGTRFPALGVHACVGISPRLYTEIDLFRTLPRPTLDRR